MADKKKEEKKIVLERTYNVPLRREFLKAPKWNRTKKAVSAVKKFISKHMKSDDVRLGKYLNLELWKHGIKNPPHHVKVECKKDDKDVTRVEIVGAPVEKPKEDKKGKKKETTPEAKIEEKTEKKKTTIKKKEAEKTEKKK